MYVEVETNLKKIIIKMSIKGCFNQENIMEQKPAQIELGENVYDKNVRKRVVIEQMSHLMRKPAFCICKNKDTDQLCGNCKVEQRLCFRYMDNSHACLLKSEISNF